MNEHEPPLERVPDHETLQNAWKALAETLVLRAQEINPLIGELPATPEGHQPYDFSQPLDRAFVHNNLLDDKSLAVSDGAANYLMPHRVNPDDSEVGDDIGVRWTARIQGTDILIRHAIVIDRVVTPYGEQFNGYTYEQYVEILPDGSERRVSRDGYTYSDDNPTEDFEHIMYDLTDDMRPITIDAIDKIHAVAEQIKSQNR